MAGCVWGCLCEEGGRLEWGGGRRGVCVGVCVWG